MNLLHALRQNQRSIPKVRRYKCINIRLILHSHRPESIFVFLPTEIAITLNLTNRIAYRIDSWWPITVRPTPVVLGGCIRV